MLDLPLDELAGQNPREAGDVIDVLVRVQGGQLAAELGQAVDDLGFCGAKTGVKALTLYSFSAENWNRPEQEVSALMDLFADHLRANSRKLQDNDIVFNVIVRTSELNDTNKDGIDDAPINSFTSLANAANRMLDMDLAACVNKTGFKDQGYKKASVWVDSWAPIPQTNRYKYQFVDRMIFDGLVSSVDGDLPSLGFFVAGVDGKNVARLYLQGHTYDYDPTNTAGYLFSVATPQFVPPIQER